MLSSSEIQRVVITSALAIQPKLLILDEAFSRLTSEATEILLERLQQWAQEPYSLIVLFEHNHFPFRTRCQ